MAAERRASPKFIGGIALMGVSFVPFFISLAIVAAPTLRSRLSWLTVTLIIVSNVLWYLGILLMGPDVYKAMKKKFRARRRRRESEDENGTD